MILRPLLRPITSSPLHGMFGRETFPSGAILHFDANADPYTEQTGGPHTFNYSILSPQYQRQADGSSIDVGANPAVDVFDGEKWLRTCGQVQNLLPSGAQDLTTWAKSASGVVSLAGGFYKITPTTENVAHSINTIGFSMPVLSSGTTYTVSVDISSAGYSFARVVSVGSAPFGVNVNLTTGAYSVTTGPCVVGVSLYNGVATISVSVSATSSAVTNIYIAALGSIAGTSTFVGNGTSGIIARNLQVTATAYPVPYVPPGVTQPASNATTTNGCWFTLADGSPVDGALTGGAMTAGIKARLAFASTDLPNSSVLNLLTPDDVAGRFLTIQTSAGGVLTANLSDGTNTATVPLAAWARGDVLQFFPQVPTGATQMRIGYKTAAASAITWGDLATYAGTFGPDATLLRLMIGYANAYPMGTNKLAFYTKQMADADIIKAVA